LPPPHNRELTSTLVRVIGETDSPQAVFRSDTLARLGIIGKSPGPDFFTAFASLSPSELDRLKRDASQIASGAFGKPTRESVLFSGRAAVARTSFPAIDSAQLNSLVKYVQLLHHPNDRGGQPLWHLGPVVEGAVGLIAVGALAIVLRMLGTRT